MSAVHSFQLYEFLWSLIFVGFAAVSIFWTFVQFTAWYGTRQYGALLLMLISALSAFVSIVFSLTFGIFRILPFSATNFARSVLLVLWLLWVTYTVYHVRIILKLRKMEDTYAVAEKQLVTQQAEANELRIHLQEENEDEHGLA